VPKPFQVVCDHLPRSLKCLALTFEMLFRHEDHIKDLKKSVGLLFFTSKLRVMEKAIIKNTVFRI
jgi:hypothetical protein